MCKGAMMKVDDSRVSARLMGLCSIVEVILKSERNEAVEVKEVKEAVEVTAAGLGKAAQVVISKPPPNFTLNVTSY